MQVKIKKIHPDAPSLTKANKGDAGFDLTATSFCEKRCPFDDISEQYIEYGTGIAIEIPEGFVGLLFPRSSVSNRDLILANSVGVIDSSYRGEIKLRFKKLGIKDYRIGEKIGQLVILSLPLVEIIEVKDLSQTERADKGFGSSGT